MGPSALRAAALRRKQSTPNHYAVSTSTTSQPTLTLFDLTLLGIGGTLGSGLFLLTGRAARNVAGPAVSVSFVLAAFACLFSALSYAEMSSRLPNSGGAYAFAYAALGELPAFLVGMCLTLEYGVSSAAVARSWASYLGDTVGVFPSWLSGISSQFCVLGALLIVLIALLVSTGMHHAKWIINAGTLLYASVVGIIVIYGSRKIEKDNWDPFFPFGIHGAVMGAGAIFFSYIGFDEVATVSEEALNAARNVPLAIVISLFAVSVMYISAALVLTGTVNYKNIDLDAPFSAAMRAVGLPLVAKLVGIGTALGMMNTALVGFTAQPRIFIAMGRDGLLPRAVSFNSRITTFGCGVLVALLALVIDTQALADVVSGGTLLAFLSTNIAVLLTRSRFHTRDSRTSCLVYTFVACAAASSIIVRIVSVLSFPLWAGLSATLPLCLVPGMLLLVEDFEGGDACERAPPAFLCPLVPAFPLAGAFTTVFLLFQLPVKALSALCIWLTLSTITYFSYGAKNAIIANEYHTVNGSPSHSFNSFEELAMEANSLSEDSGGEGDTAKPAKVYEDKASSGREEEDNTTVGNNGDVLVDIDVNKVRLEPSEQFSIPKGEQDT